MTDSAPKPRALRFSRWMMIAIATVAIVSLALYSNRISEQRAAIDWLKRHVQKESYHGDLEPPPLFWWIHVAVYWHSSPFWDSIPVNRMENEDLQQYRRELARIQARFPEWDLADYSSFDPPVPPLPSVP